MTIKTTRYSPDTCSCVIEYTWDDSVPEDQRVHTLDNYISKCPAHSPLATDQDRWNAVFDENPRKNNALQNILDNGPSSLFDTTPEGARTLKGNITFNYSFTGTAPNRVLNISFSGITLTQNQKNTIQSVLTNRFGVGKVLIA